MAGRLFQLKLLLGKNWTVKKRSPWSTVFEVLVPVAAMLILVVIRTVVKIDKVPESLHINLAKDSLDYEVLSTFVTRTACGGDISWATYAPDAQVALVPGTGSASDKNLRDELLDFLTATAALFVPPNVTFPCPGGRSLNVSDYLVHELFRSFDSEKQMDEYVDSNDYGKDHQHRPLIMAVIVAANSPTNPRTFNVVYRGNYSLIPYTNTQVNPFLTSFDNSVWRKYLETGLISFKFLVDRFLISKASRVPVLDALPRSITVVPFPQAHSRDDNFPGYVKSVYGLFLIVAFMWPFSRMVRNIVDEKERRIKEGMRMMGLDNTSFWLSWCFTYFVIFFVFLLIILLPVKLTLFPNSNFFLVLLFFLLFIIDLITLAALVSTFFNRAKTAGTLSVFILFGFYLPFFAVADDNTPIANKTAACLCSPVAFTLGSMQFLTYEGAFIGQNFSNVGDEANNFRLSIALWFMLMDALLYGAMAWYCEKVLPKEFGSNEPWHFLFHTSYWCPESGASVAPRKSGSTKGELQQALLGGPAQASYGAPPQTPPMGAKNGDWELRAHDTYSYQGSVQLREPPLVQRDDEQQVEKLGPHVEPVPPELQSRLGISMKGLRKVFTSGGQENVAVQGLDLECYEGQVFVLLGHNGAGKTTTIHMMTGMMNPSEGSATVAGFDVFTEMHKIRRVLGVCPQHNILFDSLTVVEHLRFYARLKSVPESSVAAAVAEAIREVQLESSENQVSSSLSGGQKRRLSLAIALIGDSRVIFLDEPTSGVDPFSRRAIWDLLATKKEGRTIVLTTHFMDEADQLGDRIAIMHKGGLKCCGSSLFLRRLYGVGYTLTITKSNVQNNRGSHEGVRQLLQSHVPSSKLLSQVGTEISFQLPLSSSAQFPDMLRELDRRSEELGVATYGLSATTLEEVFLKVAREEDEDVEQRIKSQSTVRRLSSITRQRSHSGGFSGHGGFDEAQGDMKALEASTTHRGFSRDIRALVMKRFHSIKRDRKATCCQFLVPLILLCLGLGFLRIPPSFSFPKISLAPADLYPAPVDMLCNNAPPVAGADDMITQIKGLSAEYTVQGVNAEFAVNLSRALLAAEAPVDTSRYGSFFFGGGGATDAAIPETIWVFNNFTALHSMPAFMNLANQAVLRLAVNDSNAKLNSFVHPFAFTQQEKRTILAANGIFASIVMALAYSFIPASYCVFVVKEREYKCKHLQTISGVEPLAYWTSNYLWDFACFLIPAIAGIIIIAAFGNPNFTGENSPVVLLDLFLFGLSVIPFTYALSFMFRSHSTAQNVMILIYLLGGILLLIVSFVLYVIPSTSDLNDKFFRRLFRLVPSFCLADVMFWLSVRKFGQLDKWDMRISGESLTWMAAESFVYFGLTLLLEYLTNNPRSRSSVRRDPALPVKEPEPQDEDVREEKRRIEEGRAREDSITLKGLRKTFFPRKIAVDNLWFSLGSGECFGFLGVNGAGKTTTLQMLTGDVIPSSGTASIGGYDIAEFPEKVRRLMGYCPQFDALYEHLTAIEHLYFYGRIRGVPEDRMEDMVRYLIERLTLTPYARRPAGTYSGGNKRKLQVAIALIGNPPCVLLDEPSTGMDPVSRRFMWDFISETMAQRAVILTTHSMEECEALCNRIGILVLGRLKCIGTSQHLKNRFGQGFQLDISTAGSSPDQARQLLTEKFRGAEPIEIYGGKLKYRLPPQDGMTLADIFSVIEQNKQQAAISEYAISQTTLEQIFIAFARQGEVQASAELQAEQAAYQQHYVGAPWQGRMGYHELRDGEGAAKGEDLPA